MTLELIGLCGTGLAAPSANRFGAVSPTTAGHVVDDLADFLDPARDVILDGGPCPIGVESTIVDFCNGPAQILRAGGVTPEQVVELLASDLAEPSGPARRAACWSRTTRHGVEWSWSKRTPMPSPRRPAPETRSFSICRTISQPVLGRCTRICAAADDRGVTTIIAVMPAPVGLGHAIRDRLTKAAAPRTAD